MIATLKRTLTDIMEDELYSLPHQPTNNINSSTEDLSNYIHMNGSQDSIIRIQEDEPLSQQSFLQYHQQPQQSQQAQHHQQPSYHLDNIYNSYANPSLFTNSMFPDDLYDDQRQASISQHQQQPQQQQQQSHHNEPEIVNPKDTATVKEETNIPNNNDVLLVPQDNYIIYDHSQTDHAQFLPELLQWEINNKSFPQSNELNIFKTNDVYLDEEFSDDDQDDEDEDDDMEFQNKLDDMEMDLDDLSSESSIEDEDEDDYFMTNAYNQNHDNTTKSTNNQYPIDNSIYSLTTPQTINPRLVQNNYIDSSTASVFDDEDGEEEEDNFSDASDDLYTPTFDQRRESVMSEQKPVVLSSSNANSNKVSQKNKESTTHVLRKLKAPSIENQNAEDEEHICLISNPKTGKPCNKRFSRPYDLIRHQNTIHASRRSYYRCMFCEDDLRRRNQLNSVNPIVIKLNYRSSSFSIENSNTNLANSHNSKKIPKKTVAEDDYDHGNNVNNDGNKYLSNKTFSRCDALTRHLRFRHGLNNLQVNEAMDFAKKHVEYYEN